MGRKKNHFKKSIFSSYSNGTYYIYIDLTGIAKGKFRKISSIRSITVRWPSFTYRYLSLQEILIILSKIVSDAKKSLQQSIKIYLGRTFVKEVA